ncbi:MAG: FAD-binding oxidoreductase [Rhizobiales bacterium]|nr:FAD-binding oxidoreductase [Hyphomicrobiales bacterium]MBI3672196.1 FAD-binding oxidoreductase [Hyphomicrobiales bacterium]
MQSTETWYEATAARGPARRALTGGAEAEVCVIGGGLAGLTAALELARRGVSAILLEAKRLAWGASGRNGGFVSNGFAWGMDGIAARLGLEAARDLYRLSCFGTEYVRREIVEGDPSIKMGDGWLGCIRYDNAAERMAEVAAQLRDYGQEKHYLDVAATRALVNTTRYFQSALDPTAFHMHPLRYALMIAAKAEGAGARLFEMSLALEVRKSDAGYRVRTGQGEVSCRDVVYCVSSLDRAIHPPTGRAVVPVATYIAVTEPLTQDAIRTRYALSDSRRAGNYFRLIDEGRLLWGGAITTRVWEPRRLAERMKRDMLSVFPQLGNPRIDYAWAGLMGYARHFMPLIGTDGKGQWWATAFGGHGMNTTAMGGILMARAIAAGDDEYRRFAPFTPQWVGGPFGRAGVQAGYWYLQLKDRLDERRSRRAA